MLQFAPLSFLSETADKQPDETDGKDHTVLLVHSVSTWLVFSQITHRCSALARSLFNHLFYYSESQTDGEDGNLSHIKPDENVPL